MPFNFDLENIVLQNKTRDMLPFFSTTMLRVKCCKLKQEQSETA